MAEEQESIGRIEVAPEVLATIVHYATVRVEGVVKMAPVPADAARLFRQKTRQNGILLDLTDEKVKLDIYVIMSPKVNIMEASQKIQAQVIEAIDTMVGIEVDAVNIHVEDVVYAQEEVS
jgi:uncharacterized alkaline shock family protein YloU